jgi:hypothetical protein
VRQQLLFETQSLAGPNSEGAPESNRPGTNAKDRREAQTHTTVAPLANLCLRETCAYCGREIGPAGCIIPEFEELGAFCSQECADRRFRIYLENEA